MSLIFGFLTSKWGLAGIAVALVLGVIGVQTLRLAHAKSDLTNLRAADAKIAAEVKAHEATAATISKTSETKIAAARVEVQTVTRTLIQKVPVYVPAAADSKCIIPNGFVQLHDAATGLPAAPGGPVEAASGVPLSGVLSTVIANYGAAKDWRAEALGWRDWYATQKAAWDRP